MITMMQISILTLAIFFKSWIFGCVFIMWVVLSIALGIEDARNGRA